MEDSRVDDSLRDGITSFLILPIDRVSQYAQTFKVSTMHVVFKCSAIQIKQDLLAYTPVRHQEYQPLVQALEEINALEKELETKKGNIHKVQYTVDVFTKISGAEVCLATGHMADLLIHELGGSFYSYTCLHSRGEYLNHIGANNHTTETHQEGDVHIPLR